jgi:hypothetical protein
MRNALVALRMEGSCQRRHMEYLKRSHWRYCPWCGMILQVRLHCDHCNRDFMSEAAFNVHREQVTLFASNRCPNGSNHPVRYLRRRQKMFCPACNLEYKVKREESEHENLPEPVRS